MAGGVACGRMHNALLHGSTIQYGNFVQLDIVMVPIEKKVKVDVQEEAAGSTSPASEQNQIKKPANDGDYIEMQSPGKEEQSEEPAGSGGIYISSYVWSGTSPRCEK